jgi:uncharacterized membrane protein HdeD (DUF308 family)
MSEWLSASWKMLTVRGIVGLVFGVIAIVWPDITLLSLVILWAVWALFDGVGSLLQAAEPGTDGGRRALLVIMGIIAVLAGLFAIFRPFTVAVALAWVIGIWLIVRGVFELFGAFSSRRTVPRWLLLLGGVLSLVLGVLCVLHPETATFVFVFWLGIVAVAWGIVFLVTGLVLRREVGKIDSTAESSPV